jgi:hypothetical protein
MIKTSKSDAKSDSHVEKPKEVIDTTEEKLIIPTKPVEKKKPIVIP